jgi:hypothetical protein
MVFKQGLLLNTSLKQFGLRPMNSDECEPGVFP